MPTSSTDLANKLNASVPRLHAWDEQAWAKCCDVLCGADRTSWEDVVNFACASRFDKEELKAAYGGRCHVFFCEHAAIVADARSATGASRTNLCVFTDHYTDTGEFLLERGCEAVGAVEGIDSSIAPTFAELGHGDPAGPVAIAFTLTRQSKKSAPTPNNIFQSHLSTAAGLFRRSWSGHTEQLSARMLAGNIQHLFLLGKIHQRGPAREGTSDAQSDLNVFGLSQISSLLPVLPAGSVVVLVVTHPENFPSVMPRFLVQSIRAAFEGVVTEQNLLFLLMGWEKRRNPIAVLHDPIEVTFAQLVDELADPTIFIQAKDVVNGVAGSKLHTTTGRITIDQLRTDNPLTRREQLLLAINAANPVQMAASGSDLSIERQFAIYAGGFGRETKSFFGCTRMHFTL